MVTVLVACVLENGLQSRSLESSLQKELQKTMRMLLTRDSHSIVCVVCACVCVCVVVKYIKI